MQNNMIHIMHETIRTFEEVFSEYRISGYKFPENLNPGIEWYNANISMIALAHTCPMTPIQVITQDTYMWAYASGLIACAHMNCRLISTQNAIQ
jgi:hypothetical protein